MLPLLAAVVIATPALAADHSLFNGPVTSGISALGAVIAAMPTIPTVHPTGVNVDQLIALAGVVFAPALAVSGFVFRWARVQHQRNEKIDAVVLGYTDQAGVAHPGIVSRLEGIQAVNGIEHSQVTERLDSLNQKVDALDEKVTTTAQIAADTATVAAKTAADTTTLITALASGDTG